VSKFRVNIIIDERSSDSPTIGIMLAAEDGLILGDYAVKLKPGDSALGYTYEEYAFMGSGSHVLETK
jgi:hypothetical protein